MEKIVDGECWNVDAALSRIVVRRPGVRRRDLLRSYRVKVDGENRGRVARGGRVEIEVSPGRHTVQATIDWTGSPVVEIDVPEGSSVSLCVEPAGSALLAPFQVWRRDSYIQLTVEESL